MKQFLRIARMVLTGRTEDQRRTDQYNALKGETGYRPPEPPT